MFGLFKRTYVQLGIVNLVIISRTDVTDGLGLDLHYMGPETFLSLKIIYEKLVGIKG